MTQAFDNKKFQDVFPFSFELMDEEGEASIYIVPEDIIHKQQLRIQISNTSGRPLYLNPLSLENGPNAEQYHFELRFRTGTLSKISLGEATPTFFEKESVADYDGLQLLKKRTETKKPFRAGVWLISKVQIDENKEWVSFYIARTSAGAPWLFNPENTITLTLNSLSAAVNIGTRETRVELVPGEKALYYTGPEKEWLVPEHKPIEEKEREKRKKRKKEKEQSNDTAPNTSELVSLYTWKKHWITEPREHTLRVINHLGEPVIPLHLGFIGPNTVLNDGEPNKGNLLEIRITNTSPKRTIYFQEHSRMYLQFDSTPYNETSTLDAVEGDIGYNNDVKKINIYLELTKRKWKDLRGQFNVELEKERKEIEKKFSTIEEQINATKQEIEKTTSDSRRDQLQERIPTLVNKLVELDKLKKKDTKEALKEKENRRKIPVDYRSQMGQQYFWTIDYQHFKAIRGADNLTIPPKGTLTLLIDLNDFHTDHPAGLTFFRIHYENILGYWDGELSCPIEITPLRVEAISTEDNKQVAIDAGDRSLIFPSMKPMSIGTKATHPEAQLYVYNNSDKPTAIHVGSDHPKGARISLLSRYKGGIKWDLISAGPSSKYGTGSFLIYQSNKFSRNGTKDYKPEIRLGINKDGKVWIGPGPKPTYDQSAQLTVIAENTRTPLHLVSDHEDGTSLRIRNSSDGNEDWNFTTTGKGYSTESVKGAGNLVISRYESDTKITIDKNADVHLGGSLNLKSGKRLYVNKYQPIRVVYMDFSLSKYDGDTMHHYFETINKEHEKWHYGGHMLIFLYSSPVAQNDYRAIIDLSIEPDYDPRHHGNKGHSVRIYFNNKGDHKKATPKEFNVSFRIKFIFFRDELCSHSIINKDDYDWYH